MSSNHTLVTSSWRDFPAFFGCAVRVGDRTNISAIPFHFVNRSITIRGWNHDLLCSISALLRLHENDFRQEKPFVGCLWICLLSHGPLIQMLCWGLLCSVTVGVFLLYKAWHFRAAHVLFLTFSPRIHKSIWTDYSHQHYHTELQPWFSSPVSLMFFSFRSICDPNSYSHIVPLNSSIAHFVAVLGPQVDICTFVDHSAANYWIWNLGF